MKDFLSYLKLFFSGRSSKLFFGAVLIGLAFSISVIISTFSLMQGFETSLDRGLEADQGHLIVSGRRSFFEMGKIEDDLKKLKATAWAPIVTSESFLVLEGISHGVLVLGIERDSFKKITGKKIELSKNGVAIGEEISKKFNLKLGDKIELMFASGNKSLANTPVVHAFTIEQVFKSQIYLHSLRSVYIEKKSLQKILDLDNRINKVLVNAPIKDQNHFKEYIENFVLQLQERLGFEYMVRPYWSKYKGLFKAVRVEKFYIVTILQVIVIVSIFNIMAILLFIGEQKAAQIFLLRVLGMTHKGFDKFWYGVMLTFWLGGVLLSFLFTYIFSLLLENWDLFKLPGSVYHLNRLELSVNPLEVLVIISVVLLWMFIVTKLTLHRWKKRSLIRSLNKEL